MEGVDKAPSRKVSLVLIGHTAMDYILDPINDALFATTRCYDDGDNDYDDDADDVVSRESRQWELERQLLVFLETPKEVEANRQRA